ncbi:MAG: GNAT family N-acetyltransferase [Actinobacteria bacterium]|nr:GNAT family N-acetyltransferase [Actinomycetota bacterium]
MTFVVEDLDTRTAPDGLLRGVYEVVVRVETEDLPQGPATPYEQWVLRTVARPPEHLRVHGQVAIEDGVVVGHSYWQTWPEQDPDNAFALVRVHPDHRRRGVGRALLSGLVGRLREEGRGKLIVDCVEGRPWETVLARLGMKKSLTERRSRLHVSALDRDLMDLWIARASERGSDYDVVFLDAPVPDEQLDNWVKAKTAINDEPFEDLEFEVVSMTPERWRDHERFVKERGEILLACAARHVPTGELVGATVLYIQEHMKALAVQGDTAVMASHRNRGLGRLIKGAMARRVATDYPNVEIIETHNAGSNDAMLGINIEMGFEPVLVISAWQGGTETIQAALTR